MVRDTKRRHSSRDLKSTLRYLEDYSSNTSVHGVHYIFDRQRHWSERLGWLIVVTLSLVVCLWQINKVYQKWQNSPVIVSLAGKSTPIWDIPFPAVTICSESKAKRTELDFTKTFETMINANFNPPEETVSADELRKFLSMQEVCEEQSPEQTHNGTIDGNIGDILRSITTTENIEQVIYNQQFLEGSEFRLTMTQEGVCYTFNMLSPKQFYQDGVVNEIDVGVENDIVDSLWNPDFRYLDKPNQSYDYYCNSLPRRSFRAGIRGGLKTQLIHYKEDLDFKCRPLMSGYRFLLHPPDEFPQIHQYFNLLPFKKLINVGIIPTVQSTSETLRKYDSAQRQCYFNSERKLKFFRVYTQRNCELECLTNDTLSECKCVRLGMPRFNSTQYCDASKRECYTKVEEKLLENSLIEDKAGRPQKCNCLPSCLAISYDAEISQSDGKLKETIRAFENIDPDVTELNNYYVSSMSVFFKDKQFTESQRSELYGVYDFLANVGGSLGLFMGFSLLSAVELIYFCTLRLFFNIRRPDTETKQTKL